MLPRWLPWRLSLKYVPQMSTFVERGERRQERGETEERGERREEREQRREKREERIELHENPVWGLALGSYIYIYV